MDSSAGIQYGVNRASFQVGSYREAGSHLKLVIWHRVSVSWVVPDQSNPPFPIAGHEWVPETTTWIGPLAPISFSLSSFPSSQSFFEVQVNTSVILRVVVVLLVLEF